MDTCASRAHGRSGLGEPGRSHEVLVSGRSLHVTPEGLAGLGVPSELPEPPRGRAGRWRWAVQGFAPPLRPGAGTSAGARALQGDGRDRGRLRALTTKRLEDTEKQTNNSKDEPVQRLAPPRTSFSLGRDSWLSATRRPDVHQPRGSRSFPRGPGARGGGRRPLRAHGGPALPLPARFRLAGLPTWRQVINTCNQQ